MLDALVLTSAALAQTDDDYDTLPGLGLPMEEHNFGTFLVDRHPGIAREWDPRAPVAARHGRAMP